MPDLSTRSNEIEIMDDLNASGEIIDVTLKELETINLLLGGNYVTINGIARLLKNSQASHAELAIADVGCGSGDMLRLIRRWLDRQKIKGRLIGIDANPNIVAYANHHNHSSNISFHTIDIFSEEFRRQEFDIVTGTLFFHHFSDEQLVDFFSSLKKQVRIGFVINDIHRHWFAYYSIKWLTRLFSKSSMVIHDAPLSVARAFRKNELETILKRAGINKYTLRWMWAFRWQVVAYS